MNWTDDDINFLINNTDKGSKWCYENLKRGKNSVLSKARKLGIKFSKIEMSSETKNKIVMSSQCSN
jgi:hypothetical protein